VSDTATSFAGGALGVLTVVIAVDSLAGERQPPLNAAIGSADRGRVGGRIYRPEAARR
jgi:hypothetical protein